MPAMESVVSRIGWDRLFILVLSLVVVLAGAGSIRDKSETFDETFYVGIGYYLVKTGDFMKGQTWTHPPLPFYINSVPFYTLDIMGRMPEHVKMLRCFNCYDKYFYRYVYHKDYRSLNLLFLSRCAMLSTLVLLILYFFRLSRRLFGLKAACVTTTLLALNPNILAHASLATTDMTSACFNFISFYYFLKFIEEKNLKNSVKFGVAAGLSLLSNTLNLYAIPAYMLIGLWHGFDAIRRNMHDWRRKFVKTSGLCAVAAVVCLLMINAGYLFAGTPMKGLFIYDFLIRLPHISEYPATQVVLKELYNSAYVKLPIPRYYMLSAAMTLAHQKEGHNGYFSGEYSKRMSSRSYGFGPGYWITAFIIKNPEGTLLIMLAAAVYYATTVFYRRVFPERQVSIVYAYALVNIAIYAALLTASRVNTGIRLMLIIFPFIFLLLGEAVKNLLNDKRLMTLTLLAVAASLASTLYYYPDYISYFNQLIGGPENGYRYLSDSNIDWGQDLPGLKAWMDKHSITEIKLAYFGRAKIEEYGISYVSMPNNQVYFPTQRKPDIGCGPTTGILAVSATSLTGQYGNPSCYEWLRGFHPVDNVGHSILIYNITTEDVRTL